MKKIVDDSIKIKKFYKEQFDKHKDQRPVEIINGLMDEWSHMVTSKNINEFQKTLFSEALQESKECIWFEAGKHLATFSQIDKTVNDIFFELSTHSKSAVRFNIAALIPEFDNSIQYQLVSDLLADKSSRVRDKTVDSVLRSRNRKCKRLLKERKDSEKNEMVVASIDFALSNWGKKTYVVNRPKSQTLYNSE